MLSFLLMLTQSDDLTADPRLKAPVTVEERYLPLSEFSKRLSSVAKLPIQVKPRIADRKLCLFVKERPLAETMVRVADALDAHWTSTGGGWTLAPDAKTEQIETEAALKLVADRNRALDAWAAKAAIPPSNPGDVLGAKVALLLKDVGPAQAVASLLRGNVLVGTGNGRKGSRTLDMADAFQRNPIHKADGSILAIPTDGMILLKWDPTTGRVITTLRSLGEKASTGTLGWTDVLLGAKREPDEIERLDDRWSAEGEAALGESKLNTLPPESDPYGSGLASLADVLARLFARTGIPVAAESFRAPMAQWGDQPGQTISEAIGAVLDSPMIKYGAVPRFVYRGSGGWLLARTPAAWKFRRDEIPESRLVPLERKKSLSLDDYAALAGSLSEGQRTALESFRPLATFPTVALRKGYWGLVVYDALSPSLRQLALTNSLPIDRLPLTAKTRWQRAVSDMVSRTMVPERWVDAVLSDHIPADAAFGVQEGFGYVRDFDLIPIGAHDPTKALRYRSFVFHFGGVDSIDIDAPTVPMAP